MDYAMAQINTEAINRAKKGDEVVVSALYEHFHVKIFRYLYYRVGDRQTAEDLTSEVFLRMLRFIGGFQPPSASFPSWLFQIARNLAIDHFRSNGARQQVSLEEHLVSTSDTTAAIIEHKLNVAILRQSLERLTPEQRDVIVLRFVAEMSIAETAQALNKSEDAVKGLQRRALIALRQVLAEWEISYGQE